MLPRNNESIQSGPLEWTAPPKDKKTRIWSITEIKTRSSSERRSFSCLETKEIKDHKRCVSALSERHRNQAE